jgi:hypothetical protein
MGTWCRAGTTASWTTAAVDRRLIAPALAQAERKPADFMLSALRLQQMKRRAFFSILTDTHRRFLAMGCYDRLRRIVRLVATVAAAGARQTPTTK